MRKRLAPAVFLGPVIPEAAVFAASDSQTGHLAFEESEFFQENGLIDASWLASGLNSLWYSVIILFIWQKP